MSNFNKTYEFRLAPTDYLNKIFSSIPTNAFIDKGRCGIGGTTLEINNKNRCSLITAPTIAVLLDKIKSHPEIFIVYGDVSVEDIKQQLSLALPGQRL